MILTVWDAGAEEPIMYAHKLAEVPPTIARPYIGLKLPGRTDHLFVASDLRNSLTLG